MKRLSAVLILATACVLPLRAGISEPIKVEGGLVSGTPGWGWGGSRVSGHPVCGASRGGPALATAAAGGPVAGRAGSRPLLARMHAAPDGPQQRILERGPDQHE